MIAPAAERATMIHISGEICWRSVSPVATSFAIPTAGPPTARRTAFPSDAGTEPRGMLQLHIPRVRTAASSRAGRRSAHHPFGSYKGALNPTPRPAGGRHLFGERMRPRGLPLRAFAVLLSAAVLLAVLAGAGVVRQVGAQPVTVAAGDTLDVTAS